MNNTLLKIKSQEDFAGMTIDQICDYRKDMVNKYANLNKELFGEIVNLEDKDLYRNLITRKVTDIEFDLVTKLNKKIEEKKSEIRIYSLEEPVMKQVLLYYADIVINTLMSYGLEIAKSLCSEEEFKDAKNEVNEFMTSFIDEAKLQMLEGIDYQSYECDNILAEDLSIKNDMYKELESLKKEIEEAVRVSFNEYTRNGKEKDSEEIISESANFTPEQPIDVNYTAVPAENNNLEEDKKELHKRVEECTNYYYNEARVLSMIGGQQYLLQEVMLKVLEYTNSMDEMIINLLGKEPKESIASKLSMMQLDLATMINSYNPNITKDHTSIINSFKTIEVDADGRPVVFEDFFGQKISAADISYARRTPESSLPFDNSKMLNKYPAIVPIQTRLNEIGIEVTFKEVKSNYKHQYPVIQAFVYAKEIDLYRPFFIDINGTILNDTPKIILVPQSGIIEDGYMFSIDKIDLLVKYVCGSVTQNELELNDLIKDDLRAINKIIDLSSMLTSTRRDVLFIMNQAKSKELLAEAVSVDIKTRFRLNKWVSIEDFELISDSSVRESFLQGACKRVTQTIRFYKGELIRKSETSKGKQ